MDRLSRQDAIKRVEEVMYECCYHGHISREAWNKFAEFAYNLWYEGFKGNELTYVLEELRKNLGRGKK